MHHQGMGTNQAETTQLCDWRGTPIAAGAYVLYALSLANNVAMVEARTRTAGEGPLTTDRGRVWLQVLRRSTGGGVAGARIWVHVAPERITMLGGPLPDSEHPTEAERVAEEGRRIKMRKMVEKTHTITAAQRASRGFTRWCTVCGTENNQLAETPCEDAQVDDVYDDDAISSQALSDMFTPDQLARIGLTA